MWVLLPLDGPTAVGRFRRWCFPVVKLPLLVGLGCLPPNAMPHLTPHPPHTPHTHQQSVNDVRHILDAARQGFRPPEPKVPPPPAAAADDANPLAAGLPPGARVSRPQELVELHSGSAGGSMGSAGGGAAAAARPAGASTSGSKHARPGVNGAEVDQPQHRDQRRSLDAAASLGNSGGSGGGGVTAERVRSIEQAASNTGDGHGLPDPEALKAALRASVLDAAAATTTTTTSGGSAGDRQRRAAPVKHLPEVRAGPCRGWPDMGVVPTLWCVFVSQSGAAPVLRLQKRWLLPASPDCGGHPQATYAAIDAHPPHPASLHSSNSPLLPVSVPVCGAEREA